MAAGDELFGCPPSEFVEARNVLVRRLRAEGDRDAATEVSRLRRPTPSVWALNQVARHEPALVGDLREAIAHLRTATQEALQGDPSGLRLAQQAERTAVDTVVEAAEAHLSGLGVPASGSTHQRMLDTLRATNADSEASALLEAGRLTEDLTSAGLGLEGFSGSTALPTGTRKRRDRAATATSAADPAEEAAAKQDELARARWTKLDNAANEAEAQAASVQAEADEARRTADRAAADADKAQQAADRARDRAQKARTRADAASPL
jgi:hypothetical protein